MNREQYLKRCMAISLRHRAIWVFVGGLAGVTLATILGLPAVWWAVLALLGAGLTAVGIALKSYLRHVVDPEIQPEYVVPAALQHKDQVV